jgi:hypothetical protein
MARYFETMSGVGLWNCSKAEEVLVLNTYLTVKQWAPRDERWLVDFENHYLKRGSALLESTIAEFNRCLVRKKLPPLTLTETAPDDFARDPERQTKLDARRHILLELTQVDQPTREDIVAAARTVVAAQPPPHQTWKEYQERREGLERDAALSREEVARRLAAVEQPKKRTTYLELDEAQIALEAVDDEKLRAEVLDHVARDQIPPLLQRVSDASLKTLLVRRLIACSTSL